MSAPRWITPGVPNLVGVYPSLIAMELQLEALPVLPAINVTYKIISGSLPDGLSIRTDGLISGTPSIVSSDLTKKFVVRATDNLGNIRDRTFEIKISGQAQPTFNTSGSLSSLLDSEWVEIAIPYTNPIPDNPVFIRVLQGTLPPGLEVNEYGLIRGYPEPPITLVNLAELTTVATATDGSNNTITVLGTNGFRVNRPITFSGSTFGGISNTQVYYVKSVVNATQITISVIPGGETFILNTDAGFMDVTLPQTSLGQPAKRQFNFTLELISPLGNDSAAYSITVINQNLPTNQGGPGYSPNSRTPTIYNTRPPVYNIEDDQNFGYFVLPPNNEVAVPGTTYLPTQQAYIGQFLSGNFFAFRLLGHDFDENDLTYTFGSLPSWLTGDPNTGWIYGTPSVALNNIEEYAFSVLARKKDNSAYFSPTFNFKFTVANNITGDVVWITDSNLGTIYNATNSTLNVKAESDVPLTYELVSSADSLPPNLSLTSNGDLEGVVSYQPTDNFLEKNAETTYTFVVKAYNPDIKDLNNDPLIISEKTFTLTVKQEYDIPTDNLYIKCTPSVADRNILRTLLDNTTLIPNDYIFRPTDPYFGKASSIVYAHAYGIYSSDIDEYIEAVKKNHYWRNITLGQLKTAIAKNEKGEIIYEVVYSTIIDNLQKYNPNYDYDYRYSESIDEEIFWPRFIDLDLGPWYTSSTGIYTSYIFDQEAQLITNLREYNLLTQTGIPLLMQEGIPTFYTSLSPGYARLLYPNSLENMRKRVGQELGVNYNAKLLPSWMTSQQQDGSTLGFTPAWVICYTKVPEPVSLTAIATSRDTSTVTVSSTDGLIVGGKIVFFGDTFGGIQSNTDYYVSSIDTINTKIQISKTQYGEILLVENSTGSVSATFSAVSYAEIIKRNIENNWPYTLNKINFQIDRFIVDKELTYNFATKLEPKVWTRYPSGTPVPDPADSDDFYVLFPQKTILPNKPQYY